MTSLTLRQLFAAQAAAGILSNPGETGATLAQHIATRALEVADALVIALGEPPAPPIEPPSPAPCSAADMNPADCPPDEPVSFIDPPPDPPLSPEEHRLAQVVAFCVRTAFAIRPGATGENDAIARNVLLKYMVNRYLFDLPPWWPACFITWDGGTYGECLFAHIHGALAKGAPVRDRSVHIRVPIPSACGAQPPVAAPEVVTPGIALNPAATPYAIGTRVRIAGHQDGITSMRDLAGREGHVIDVLNGRGRLPSDAADSTLPSCWYILDARTDPDQFSWWHGWLVPAPVTPPTP